MIEMESCCNAAPCCSKEKSLHNVFSFWRYKQVMRLQPSVILQVRVCV